MGNPESPHGQSAADAAFNAKNDRHNKIQQGRDAYANGDAAAAKKIDAEITTLEEVPGVNEMVEDEARTEDADRTKRKEDERIKKQGGEIESYIMLATAQINSAEGSLISRTRDLYLLEDAINNGPIKNQMDTLQAKLEESRQEVRDAAIKKEEDGKSIISKIKSFFGGKNTVDTGLQAAQAAFETAKTSFEESIKTFDEMNQKQREITQRIAADKEAIVSATADRTKFKGQFKKFKETHPTVDFND